MRIRIVLAMKGITISRHPKHLLQGAIYRMIATNPDLIELHNEGVRVDNRPYKLFTFSDLYGNADVVDQGEETRLSYRGDAWFEFASLDDRIVYTVFKQLNDNPYLTLGVIRISIVSIESKTTVKFLNGEIRFRTLSPVTVYRTEGKKVLYLDPTTEEYRDSLVQNLENKHLAAYGIPSPVFSILEIVPLKRHRIEFGNHFVLADELRVTFTTLPQSMLDILLNCGLGAKNSSGFGMVYHEKDVLSLEKRITP